MKVYKYVTNLLQRWLYTTKIMLSIMFKSEILRCIFGPLAREKILGLFLKHNLQTKNRSSYFPRKQACNGIFICCIPHIFCYLTTAGKNLENQKIKNFYSQSSPFFIKIIHIPAKILLLIWGLPQNICSISVKTDPLSLSWGQKLPQNLVMPRFLDLML